MKRLYIGTILFLLYFSATGQVVFDQVPRDLQLYPRNASNQAEVVISGKVGGTGYTKIGVQVLREGVLSNVVSQVLTPSAASSAFTLTTAIRAEAAEYSFRVFSYKGTDSTLVTERKRVVCGDVYIIYGQSNALALAGLDIYYSFNFDDKYMRNAVYPYGGKPADIAWYAAKQPYASVGGFGLSLQRFILETYKIPTCVINGAQGGVAISALITRNANNPADPTTYYGDMLYRAQWAGVAKQAKAIIWKHGEEDAGTGIPGYAGKFTTLYNQLRQDYGTAFRFYVGQINILPPKSDSAAALRDFQRRTRFLFPNTGAIATVGTPGYDGVHYTGLANQQLAFEQFRQIARDVYGATDTLQINSPDIKKVYYNARKDTVTLVFDEQMQMVWKADTTLTSQLTGAKYTRQLKDYFYLDGQAGLVTGGSANGNRVLLALKQPASAKTLRYLPAYFADDLSSFYDGPTLRNTRGMRAFSFDNVPIGTDAVAPATALVAKSVVERQVQLAWTAPVGVQGQLVERADAATGVYRQIATLPNTATTYTDNNLPDPYKTYSYRIRAYSPTAESPASNVVTIKPLASVVLGIDPVNLSPYPTDAAFPALQLYPNPLNEDRLLNVVVPQVAFTECRVQDLLLGRVVKSWQGSARNTLVIDLSGLEAGIYIVSVYTVSGQTLRQKVVVR